MYPYVYLLSGISSYLLFLLVYVAAALAPSSFTSENTFKIPNATQSTQDEIIRGNARLSQLHQMYKRDEDAQDYQRAQRILSKLLSAVPGDTDTKLRVAIFKSTLANAHALEGHWLIIHSGLITSLQSDSELAAVFAHELGHILSRHPEQNHLKQTLTSSEQQGEEFEADRIATLLLAKASYEPEGMITFLNRVERALKKSNRVESSQASHPVIAERIAKLRSLPFTVGVAPTT